VNDYWHEGAEAYEDCVDVNMNPYEEGTDEYNQWEAGWQDALYHDDYSYMLDSDSDDE